MFVENVVTTWVEALKALYHDPAYPMDELRDINITPEFPIEEVDYPCLWVNYTMQGDVKNVGIGHEEFYLNDQGEMTRVFRWHFGGFVEISLAALGNLERARMIDALTRDIAVARVDQNREGILRSKIERSDLIGQIVTWESITISGWGEGQGTPWGTDDVLYEVTVTLVTSGEVVLDPQTGALVPLSAIITTPLLEGDPSLPTAGVDGWR